MRMLVGSVAVAMLLLASVEAHAVVHVFNFTLDGLQEAPTPVVTTGMGTAEVTLDTDSFLLTWDVAYSNLLAPSTAAHFHGPAPVGVAAGVVVDIGSTGPLGGTSGTFVGSTTITATQAQQVVDGLWYINIHSQMFPAGEIRGQVVPGPAGLALLSLSMLAGPRRRRV